jgi:hypothetical protein
MKINLIPQRREDTLELFKNSNSLTVNGEIFDFSPMNDGDILPYGAISSEWFVRNVSQENGELEFTIILPIPWNYSEEQLFPQPLENVPDGLVLFPEPLSEEETLAKFPPEPPLPQVTMKESDYE